VRTAVRAPRLWPALSAPGDAPGPGNLAPQSYAWLKPEQEEASANIAPWPFDLWRWKQLSEKAGGCGLNELTRMPHALDPEKGFRVRSRFTFETSSELRGLHHRALARRHLLAVCGRTQGNRERCARISAAPFRSEQLARAKRCSHRIQESRDRLEVEIRKLLHEISRIAEQALDRARKLKEEELPPYSRQLNGSTGWNGMFRHLSNLVQPGTGMAKETA